MKKILPMAAVLIGGCISISTSGVDDNREDGRETIGVSPKVLSAARARIPGFSLTNAELRDRDGFRVYELEGNAGGEDYVLEVTPGGRILRIDN